MVAAVRPGATLSLKRSGYRSWAVVVRGSRVRRAMASFMAAGRGGLWLWLLMGGWTGGGLRPDWRRVVRALSGDVRVSWKP